MLTIAKQNIKFQIKIRKKLYDYARIEQFISDWKAYKEAYKQVIKSTCSAHQKHYNYVLV